MGFKLNGCKTGRFRKLTILGVISDKYIWRTGEGVKGMKDNIKRNEHRQGNDICNFMKARYVEIKERKV